MHEDVIRMRRIDQFQFITYEGGDESTGTPMRLDQLELPEN
jgi:hypothetical protein